MKSLLMRNPVVVGLSWIGAYLVIILLPLLILLFYPPTPNEERSFWLEFSVALGFIGLAMMAMQFALAERKDERPLLLIYANKSWEDVTYREELEALKKKLDLTIVHVLREPPEDWTGETGYVDKELHRTLHT